MTERYEPVLPASVQESFEREKEKAFTLYLDFVVDGSASMYSIYPAVYFTAVHFLECLTKYEVFPRLGITVIRDGDWEEQAEAIAFDDGSLFTQDMTQFLKKLRNIRLFGGGDDGMEAIHTGLAFSLDKFPSPGRNKALLLFSDAYGSTDERDYLDYPLGQAIFFCTDQLSDEDFRFCFVREDGSLDEEASPMFIDIEKILKPLSMDFLENIVKPMKDLMKGVSVGL